jgi:endoglucanase
MKRSHPFPQTSTLVALAAAVVLPSIHHVQAAPGSVVPYLKVDQFGYLPDMRKVAVIVDPQAGANAAESFNPATGANAYQVRRWTDDAVVASRTLVPWKAGATHSQSGDRGWHLDFSTVTTPGSYYLFDTANQVGSGRFEIGPSVYDAVLRQAVRMYFYQRVNFAKSVPYAGARWTDAAAYEGANQDRAATSRWAKGNAATARDLAGGWMDAGDSNKYTTFAQGAVLQLLEAYRANPLVFADDFGIPESGNGIPDLLDEVQWELDFLKRMQDATGTGGLLLKVGLDTYDGEVTPPSTDRRPRYYLPECTSSTLAGSAMFAAAGVVYQGVPGREAYGAGLVQRAESAWNRARVTTSNFTAFQTQCDDGNIKSGDADVDASGQWGSALIAAVHLYEATGKAEYRTFVEANRARTQPLSIAWWGPYWHPMQVALLRFASLPGVTPSVAAEIRAQKGAQSGVMSVQDLAAGTDLYRAYVPDAQFHWGHNQVRSDVGNLNLDFVRFGIVTSGTAAYEEVAQQHLHWLHGCNPLGLVMLSNMGEFGAESSIRELYHVWFAHGSIWDNAITSPNGPPPGYLTGGPNRSYSGTIAGIVNQPAQKAYRDWNTGWPENSWELSEPAIYSQAAYVQLLSRLMPRVPVDTQPPTVPTGLVASSVTGSSAVVRWNAATDNVGVVAYDVYVGGTLRVSGVSSTTTSLSGLTCGTSYSVTVRARDAAGNVSASSSALALRTSDCPPPVQVVYADALASGWADWSWACTRTFSNVSPLWAGTRSIRVNYGAWGGLSLRHVTGIPTTPTTTVRFWVYSAVAAPLKVSVQTQDSGPESGLHLVTVPANRWTEFTVTRAQLGNPAVIRRLNLQSYQVAPWTAYVDDVRIVP